MKVSYTVLNIFRINDQNKTFVMCLYSTKIEYFRVNKRLSESISKGMVFVGDKIVIKEITNDGIIFENTFTEGETDISHSEVDFFYNSKKNLSLNLLNDNKSKNEKISTPNENSACILDSSTSNTNYLPYLNDVLPYNIEPIKEVSANPIFKNGLFQGKYLIDQVEVSNIKMPLPSYFIAKITQKTRINIYPTSYNPFFFAIVSSNDIFIKVVFWMESLKSYSSVKVGDIVMIKDFKMKKKWNVFDKIDLNSFTESIYFNVDEITVKELIKIKYEKKTATSDLFDKIEGSVEYLSIIMRMNMNGSMMEYVLMSVDGKKVILFYNSDTNFYNIQPRMKIKIYEVRQITRAGESMYVSTIYTQFHIEENESNEEGEKKIEQIIREEGSFDEQIANVISTKKMKFEDKKWIFGALGFVPDHFESLSSIFEYQKKEKINETEVSFNLFMKPVPISISELKKQFLVLNEVKKFILTTKVIEITDVDCEVSYFENEETKKQGSFQIVVEEDFKIYVYDNFFISNSDHFVSLESTGDIFGKEVNLAIEAFRADENNVIYYLTGIIDS